MADFVGFMALPPSSHSVMLLVGAGTATSKLVAQCRRCGPMNVSLFRDKLEDEWLVSTL
jgi:hypothetical protein